MRSSVEGAEEEAPATVVVVEEEEEEEEEGGGAACPPRYMRRRPIQKGALPAWKLHWRETSGLEAAGGMRNR
jgi:hypothetical protein